MQQISSIQNTFKNEEEEKKKKKKTPAREKVLAFRNSYFTNTVF